MHTIKEMKEMGFKVIGSLYVPDDMGFRQHVRDEVAKMIKEWLASPESAKFKERHKYYDTPPESDNLDLFSPDVMGHQIVEEF